MPPSYLADFLTLRTQGKIGRVWNHPTDNGVYLLAPDDALPMCEWALAKENPLTERALCALIDERMGRAVEKRPPQMASEYRRFGNVYIRRGA